MTYSPLPAGSAEVAINDDAYITLTDNDGERKLSIAQINAFQQDEIEIPVNIPKSTMYRVLLHLRNPGPALIALNITAESQYEDSPGGK